MRNLYKNWIEDFKREENVPDQELRQDLEAKAQFFLVGAFAQ